MPKRPASPSSSSASSLHKSPIFGILMGMSAFLVFTSFFMYSRLDVASNDDDLLLGSSQGDGMRNDAFDLRQQQRHRGRRHKKQQQQQHRDDNGGSFLSNTMKNAMKNDEGNRMAENIARFGEWKKQEARRRKKRGLLTPREEFEQEQKNPYSRDKLEALRVPDLPPPPDVPYDIHNCPKHPPKGYPFTWNALKVLGHWNPDDTDLPSSIHQSLCVFEWETDQATAYNYRTAQVPFVIRNSPDVTKASMRWNSEGYLDRLLGDEAIRNEHSHDNHFMYWKTRHPMPDFTPPTDMVDLTFAQWYEHAQNLESVPSSQQTQHQHWYFRLNAMLDKHGMVYDELPFFDPTLGETMTMIEPEEHRGINCRFGMKGVIAETHFDSSTNFISILGGQRRYILAHPDQCINMELYPQAHPSGRHSSIDWSTANQEFGNGKVDRPFVHAQVNEVVLQAGDLMYLPTYWFHYIVSLNLNYQCNSRSGEFWDYEAFIAECGFKPPAHATNN